MAGAGLPFERRRSNARPARSAGFAPDENGRIDSSVKAGVPPPPTAPTPNATSAKPQAAPTPAWSAAPNTGIAARPSAPPAPAPGATAPANPPPKQRTVSGPGRKVSP